MSLVMVERKLSIESYCKTANNDEEVVDTNQHRSD